MPVANRLVGFVQAKSERGSTLLKLGKVDDANADFEDLAVSGWKIVVNSTPILNLAFGCTLSETTDS